MSTTMDNTNSITVSKFRPRARTLSGGRYENIQSKKQTTNNQDLRPKTEPNSPSDSYNRKLPRSINRSDKERRLSIMHHLAMTPFFAEAMDTGRSSHKKKSAPLDHKGFSRTSDLSALYAIAVILVGFVFPMSEALRDQWMTNHVIASFMTYLFGVASIFLLYSQIDEYFLKKKDKKEQSNSARAINARKMSHPNITRLLVNTLSVNPSTGVDNSGFSSGFGETEDAPSNASTLLAEECDTPRVRKRETTVNENILIRDNSISNQIEVTSRRTSVTSVSSDDTEDQDEAYQYIATHYGTATLADGGDSYFQKGGTLVFAIANMVYVALRIHGEHRERVCHDSDIIIYPNYAHLIFIVLQTLFLFRECKHSLRRHKRVARFGLMHLLSANICVWLRFLMVEVVEELHHQQSIRHPYPTTENMTDTNYTGVCDGDAIMLKAAAYLFPFVLEYSLVAMTAIAFMYSTVTIRVSKELYNSVCNILHKRKVSQNKTVPISGGLKDQSHFAKSRSGLFVGVILFAAVIVSMVIFFYWNSLGDTWKASMCYFISELLLLVLLLIPCIMGMIRFFGFMYDLNESNILDHGLLLISAAFYVILELFQVLVFSVHLLEDEVHTIDVLMLVVHITAVIQSIVQTSFLIDGMQRVAVKDKHLQEKHGRGLVTFLIVANVAMWVFKSVQEKRSAQEIEMEFYGEIAWIIIQSVTVPMMLFYRFHSSICLAHMWHHAYEHPEETPVHETMVL